jgi:hypothetical protein
VDYWAVPALNFADENGFVPLTELLDKESMEYGINIVDHAILPMKESIVVIRQLTQARTFFRNQRQMREVPHALFTRSTCYLTY